MNPRSNKATIALNPRSKGNALLALLSSSCRGPDLHSWSQRQSSFTARPSRGIQQSQSSFPTDQLRISLLDAARSVCRTPNNASGWIPIGRKATTGRLGIPNHVPCVLTQPSIIQPCVTCCLYVTDPLSRLSSSPLRVAQPASGVAPTDSVHCRYERQAEVFPSADECKANPESSTICSSYCRDSHVPHGYLHMTFK